jgi:hypothetical protein
LQICGPESGTFFRKIGKRSQSLLGRIQTKFDRTEILELSKAMPGRQPRCQNAAIELRRSKSRRRNLQQNFGGLKSEAKQRCDSRLKEIEQNWCHSKEQRQ